MALCGCKKNRRLNAAVFRLCEINDGRPSDLDGDGAVRGIPLDGAVLEGEQGVVAPHADVLARADTGAALADEYVAGLGRLPAVEFDAESLGI